MWPLHLSCQGLENPPRALQRAFSNRLSGSGSVRDGGAEAQEPVATPFGPVAGGQLHRGGLHRRGPGHMVVGTDLLHRIVERVQRSIDDGRDPGRIVGGME